MLTGACLPLQRSTPVKLLSRSRLRSRLARALLLIAFCAAVVRSSGAQPADTQSRHFHLEELADGVYAAIHNDRGGYAICNAGIIDLGGKTLVFDTFLTPEAARDLKRAAEALTGRPVSFVVNSHFHNDHIRGNQVFAPEAEIISTNATRELIEKREPGQIEREREVAPARAQELRKQRMSSAGPGSAELKMWIGYYEGMAASHEELVTTLPTLTFADSLVLRGAKRSVVLKAMPGGHSPGDLVLFLPEERIVFMGDLLFVQRHPWLPDGDPNKLVEILDEVASWKPRALVPGHGPTSGAEALSTMAQYVHDVRAAASGHVENVSAADSAAFAPVPAPYRHWWYQDFYPANVRYFYRRFAENQ